jgi:hypothetical protein
VMHYPYQNFLSFTQIIFINVVLTGHLFHNNKKILYNSAWHVY